ncbi:MULTISPECIES: sugar transferase [Pseudoalteromonas]|uniref:Sugar transferase n=1 Tax=Pseudoalteromonas obscura TaxID=3048491 RepID=A0ABT7EI73_9GAMM|nr:MULTISPECIES: sugar transferase [Pseudoalteromonas]MBQ4836390.1 sugar transferase [Pseudoalteromonas luteoviolacea]MDK2594740.1 sugar transferase [Pseudoalteromonas sp. P94(2023)]
MDITTKIATNVTTASAQAANKVTKHHIDGVHHGIPVWFQRTVAALGLLAISPLLLLLMLAIKLESKGPVVFRQTRVGKFGRRFTMYKFRSMYMQDDPRFQAPDQKDSAREGVCQKYIHDPRITCIGRFIRKYSIDELPQLLNVVRGDMMLIGPRPALEMEVAQYKPAQLSRLNSEQGLTGLWQVTGRADTTFEQQVQLDEQYIVEQSIMSDVKILLKTVPCVVGAKGAY